MADLIFILITIVFLSSPFGTSLDAIVCRRPIMGVEYLLGIIVSLLIMGYLIYALLYPEKF